MPSLGEKIGEGTTSDIHAWAPGQVVKLFKPGVAARHARYEARVTRAAFAAGAPAPEVFDDVTLEGRFGFVMPRFDGPSLKQLLLTGAMSHAEVGAILATPSIFRCIRRRRRRTSPPCATGWPPCRGPPPTCFRSTSRPASWP